MKLLAHNFSGVSKQPFENQVCNARYRDKHSNCYSEEVKQIAMTLHYYSPKVYDFVHNVLLLPHPSSMRTWAASFGCEPGFYCDVIKLIGDMAQVKPYMSDIVLIIDSMVTHKGTWWHPKKKMCYWEGGLWHRSS